MKIVVVMGSPRKKDSYAICEKIKESLTRKIDGELTFDYIMLGKLHIDECKGCEQCLLKGEQYCPIKDDIQEVIDLLMAADGIILVSPVYACQVSATFKKLVDRLSYLFHRPQLVAKPIITVLTTAGGGIKETQDYLKLVANGWGCHLDGQLQVVSTRYFEGRWGAKVEDKRYKMQIDKQIEKVVIQFIDDIQKQLRGKLPRPGIYDVFMFHAMRSKTYTSRADYNYWKEQGWLEQGYYYKTKLPIGSKLIEQLINVMVKRMAGKLGIE